MSAPAWHHLSTDEALATLASGAAGLPVDEVPTVVHGRPAGEMFLAAVGLAGALVLFVVEAEKAAWRRWAPRR